jgi:LmbE family N-acetylglucosaminyl deacetylase
LAVPHTVSLLSIALAGALVTGTQNSPAQRPSIAPPAAQHPSVAPPTIAVTSDTRLLVVAPHPDDEMLGAGGLMQRVRAAGGMVHVVYLTDGDGYPEGVRFEDHVESPRPADYRGYGRQRQREARDALATIRLSRDAARFLSFPDGGLSPLMRRYWSERRRAFRSPYTRLDRPPKNEVLVADTEYRGEDLTQELAQMIGEYQPTLIVVPRKEDQHADHCASWFFLMDALTDVERVHSDYTPEVVNYIIHWYSWPFEDEAAELVPPPGLRGGTSGWIRLPLSKPEQRSKRAAIKNYRTQVHVMSWFLDGFARSNEVFSRPATTRIKLPIRRNPCG